MTTEASRGSLYPIRYLPPGSTPGLRIHELQLLTDEERDLLEVVVRDLSEQIIGTGGGTTRGFGSLKQRDTDNDWLACAPYHDMPGRGTHRLRLGRPYRLAFRA